MLKGKVENQTEGEIFDCFKTAEEPVNTIKQKIACDELNKPINNNTVAAIIIKEKVERGLK
jgi:hypothetical protein